MIEPTPPRRAFLADTALPHPRTVGWFGTTSVAMGGINQSLFLLAALFVGQGAIPGQGSAAVPLLAIGLLLSWAAQELLGRPIFAVVHPDFHEKLFARVRNRADQAFVTPMVELVFLRLDGTPIDVEVRGTSIVYDREPAVHVVARDVGLRKAQQTQLRPAAQVFAQGREGILVTDAHAHVVMLNQAFITISGYPPADVIGRNPRLLGSGRQDAEFYRAMWKAIDTHGAWQGEIWNRRRDGIDYPAWLTISAVRDDHGAVRNFIGTFSDISEQRAARERINWLSHFDPLTGLPNRALQADRCTHDISNTRRDGRPLAMMVLGIDHFKLVNDSWTHPELGAVGPARFIPIAEQAGLINGIGSWVLRQVCQDMRDWSDRGISMLPVSINISPVQFRDAALVQRIGTTLRGFSIQPRMLCIEVTEGSLIEDVPHSELLLRSLKNLGVGLSLDDFGTGYSSLSYLKRFPFDKVKIDQSFVRGISTRSQDAVIAKVVISMAHGLGLQVIAEGVETEGQCAFLRDNACDGMQGYLFSRPVPKAELESLLVADRRLPANLRQAARKGVLAAESQPG